MGDKIEVKLGDILQPIRGDKEYYRIVRCGVEAIKIEEVITADLDPGDWLFDIGESIDLTWFKDELDEVFTKVPELKVILWGLREETKDEV